MVEAIADIRHSRIFRLAGDAVKQRSKRFVQFRGNEVELLLQSRTGKRSRFRRQAARTVAVGEILHDRRTLGQHLAVAEPKRRHVALGIDGAEIRSGFGRLGRDVDAFDIELPAQLVQNDVR